MPKDTKDTTHVVLVLEFDEDTYEPGGWKRFMTIIKQINVIPGMKLKNAYGASIPDFLSLEDPDVTPPDFK